MVRCFNVACFFCNLCVLTGLASLCQLTLGIYLTLIQTDVATINRLIKTDRFDSYLVYIILVFIGLGFISLILTFFSVYAVIKRNKSLSLLVVVLWVFSLAINIVILTVLVLYYFYILPQLPSLLLRSLRQSPVPTSNLLDTIQWRYACCGISSHDDYRNLSLNALPSSCCRVPNCWHDTNVNTQYDANATLSFMHGNGCYGIIEKYVTSELWILIGVASICALLQLLAITLMCILYQRYKQVDDDPKFIISHLGPGISMDENMNNNNNSSDLDQLPQLQGSSQTIEETVEITQI